MEGVCAHRHPSTPSAALVGSDLQDVVFELGRLEFQTLETGCGGSEWLEPSAWAAVAAQDPHALPSQGTRLCGQQEWWWAQGRSPATWPSISMRPWLPPLPPRSLSPPLDTKPGRVNRAR